MTYPGQNPEDASVAQRDQEVSERDQEAQSPATSQTASQGLSEDERAELERFRTEAAHKAQAEAQAADAPPAPTHVLVLANGSRVETAGQMTQYKGVPVVGAYPIPEGGFPSE